MTPPFASARARTPLLRQLACRGHTSGTLRSMRSICLTLLVALSAAADPSGTISLELEVGETAPVTAKPGANVLCDDLQVAAGEFTADGNGFVLRALRPGSTLCGVWLAGQTPGG